MSEAAAARLRRRGRVGLLAQRAAIPFYELRIGRSSVALPRRRKVATLRLAIEAGKKSK